MKTSIATVSVPGDFREKVAAIAAAGFAGIEIFEQDFLAFDGGPREVGRMVRDHGLEILLFQPFRDFEGLPEPDRSRALARAERKFDVMGELGCDRLLVCSSVHPKAQGGVDRMAGDLRELGERAALRGITVGFEALAWGKHVFDHRDAWEVVRRADHPNLGVILDSFHTLARGIDPESIRRIPGDRIAFVQLADAPAIEMDLLYRSRHFRNMPAEGDLDVDAFLRAVLATGYGGPLSLEVFNDQFRGGDARRVAEDGHRSLLWLMDRVAGDRSPALPPRARVRGVEFVEYASQGAEAEEVEGLLASMGFARAGAHKSKAVTLWRQGDINMVVNTETKGWAWISYASHGTGVSDIGLRVPDAAAAAERARGLGAEPFLQEAVPGELTLPAVRGVGGSVLRFVDEGSGLGRVWEVEFEPLPASLGDAGLLGIDHIAETMPYEEMLSWSLFYRSILEIRRAPMIDVIDPDGLVRSQALAAPDGSFRLTLNGAETHRTLAGSFLRGSFGSGVQHVAFATADLIATADRLKGFGFDPLPMPGNYYADLAARFDLGPGFLEALRARHILYDEDEGGAFLQLYSRPWGKGQFFEILERRGAYGGYGAPNAPVRIAAQKRLIRNKAVPAA